MGKKKNQTSGLSKKILILLVPIVALGFTGIVQATITDGPDAINPPAVISKDASGAINTRQQAFNERQSVTLEEDITCSNAIISAGETVNSHMIFYNTNLSSPEVDANRVWTFDGEIICVMAERSGLLQGITDTIFGAPGTSYPGPFTGRGLETDGTDSYSINGNQLNLTMTAEEPGDWIRVLTKVEVPDDTTSPVVFCEPGTNPSGNTPGEKGKSEDNSKFLSLVGADETDGTVELYLTDTESGSEFGPFTPGTMIQVNEAKGATPKQEAGKGEIDYKIKTNGALEISATDVAGNEATESCTG